MGSPTRKSQADAECGTKRLPRTSLPLNLHWLFKEFGPYGFCILCFRFCHPHVVVGEQLCLGGAGEVTLRWHLVDMFGFRIRARVSNVHASASPRRAMAACIIV